MYWSHTNIRIITGSVCSEHVYECIHGVYTLSRPLRLHTFPPVKQFTLWRNTCIGTKYTHTWFLPLYQSLRTYTHSSFPTLISKLQWYIHKKALFHIHQKNMYTFKLICTYIKALRTYVHIQAHLYTHQSFKDKLKDLYTRQSGTHTYTHTHILILTLYEAPLTDWLWCIAVLLTVRENSGALYTSSKA